MSLWNFGKIVLRVFILLRQNNWMHRNLILLEISILMFFQSLVELGQHPKEMADTLL
jgi:amidophosphoribosyltransferase